MAVIYAGSTPKFLMRIKDENGVQLDPSNIAQVTEVKVFLYNAINGTIIGKYYLNTNPGEGWTALTIKDLGEGDKRVLMVMTSAMTTAAEGNSNMIQVDAHIVDADVPGGSRIVIKKGKFYEIKPAKSQ